MVLQVRFGDLARLPRGVAVDHTRLVEQLAMANLMVVNEKRAQIDLVLGASQEERLDVMRVERSVGFGILEAKPRGKHVLPARLDDRVVQVLLRRGSPLRREIPVAARRAHERTAIGRQRQVPRPLYRQWNVAWFSRLLLLFRLFLLLGMRSTATPIPVPLPLPLPVPLPLPGPGPTAGLA